jgi:beta-lactamase class A
MLHPVSRRLFVGLLAFAPFAQRAFADPAAAQQNLADLESKNGGRLGVAALDLGSGARIVHRAEERFALCSTFKHLAAACALARVDRGEENLGRAVEVRQSDILAHSPAVEKRVGGTITVAELCDAAITLSDNAAANLLLASFGGPAGLTEYLRSIGDETTRLDRNEPDLNEAANGDPRDTTTPQAMLETMNRLVLGEALSHASRQQLKDWLIANTTGGARIRAGVPKDWIVGDKTGTGRNGAANDVGVAWPPDRRPVLISIYYAESAIAPEARSKVIADAAKIVSAGL